MPIESIINHRYLLHEELGAGGMGRVFRATDRLTGQQVALKQVNAKTEKLQFATKNNGADLRLALTQEFKVLASVRHPNIVSVLDYGFDEQQQPYFTMELLENPQSITEIGHNQPFQIQLILMAQLTQAIAYLHRRGIIHRDLKPSNVMVVINTIDGKERLQVKVLDFGLAMEKEKVSGGIVGTIAYMSPEVLTGAAVTQASDVYAMGVIGYELYSGKYPYRRDNTMRLMSEILETIPDVDALDIDAASHIVLGRMLAKDPSDRYDNAHRMLIDYTELSGQTLETSATRESYLQAARLVGREAELDKLNNALHQVIDEQKGSVWLVGGESGVGKSRLLDEVTTLAMVRGARVLRGQAVSEGGALYNLWRPALRQLCLFTPLSDTEMHVLKMIIPDIAELTGKPLPNLPPIANPELAREQLLITIKKLFYSLNEPTIVILEDLHWAGQSLDIIAQLQESIETTPLLIIGSYRDDEQPDLPKSVANSHRLNLQRLGKESIGDLSAAILGSVTPELVELLQRETEGNVFFIVEVLRALAEDAGRLDKIGMAALPEQVFTGGVQRIVRRRLERVPENARQLLSLAAVIGREIDLGLLERFATPQQLNQWLAICEAAVVIEVQDGKWRFTHDKLREVTLLDLETDEKQSLHYQIAEALEQVYPDQAEYIPALAYHWKLANVPDKTIYYAELAGDQAIQSGLYREARRYFTDALDALLLDETRERQQIDITTKLARASSNLPDEQVHVRLREALALAQKLHDPLRQVRVLASHGAYYYTIGRMKEAVECFNVCIPQGEAMEGMEDTLMIPYTMLGRTLLFTGDAPRAAVLFEKGIRLAEKVNDLEILSGTYSAYASSLWHQGRYQEGQAAADRSLEIARTLGNPEREATNLLWLIAGSMDGGQFDAAMRYGEMLFEAAKRTKALIPFFIGNGLTGLLMLANGQIDEARERLDKALEIAKQANFVMALPQYMAGRAAIRAIDGEGQMAVEQIQTAFDLEAESYQAMSNSELQTQAARLYRALGDLEQARYHAEEALHKAKSIWHKANAQIELLKLDLANASISHAEETVERLQTEFSSLGLNWHLEKLAQIRFPDDQQQQRN